MKVKLQLTKGERKGRKFVVKDEGTYLVGRSPEADFRFPEDELQISRRHFLLEISTRECYLEDLNSTNGTIVNHMRVGRCQLHDSDSIQIGQSTLQVTIREILRCERCGKELEDYVEDPFDYHGREPTLCIVCKAKRLWYMTRPKQRQRERDSIVKECAKCGRLISLREVDILMTPVCDQCATDVHKQIEALVKIGEPAVPDLIDLLKLIKEAVAEALGKIGEPAVPYLIKALQDENFHVSSGAASALGKVGMPAMPHLIKAIQDEYWLMRQGAVHALGEIGSREAVSHLMEALKDEDGRVCSAAASALKIIGEPVVPDLVQALMDKDGSVRHMAAVALGEIGPAAKISTLHLVRLLKDNPWYVQTVAAKALGRIGDHLAVHHLIERVKDKHEFSVVREAAAEALGEIGDRVAVPYLVNALEDDDLLVRRVAAMALENLEGRS